MDAAGARRNSQSMREIKYSKWEEQAPKEVQDLKVVAMVVDLLASNTIKITPSKLRPYLKQKLFYLVIQGSESQA